MKLAWRIFTHIFCFFVAIALGRIWTEVESFGCAVGDPPCENGFAIDPLAIWITSTLIILAVVYVFRGAIWLLAKRIRKLRGSADGHVSA
jgi:hypothetical protein